MKKTLAPLGLKSAILDRILNPNKSLFTSSCQRSRLHFKWGMVPYFKTEHIRFYVTGETVAQAQQQAYAIMREVNEQSSQYSAPSLPSIVN
jgi:hypothetical protein